MPPPSSPGSPKHFAYLLNHLFATRRGTHGLPYTLTEVSRETGLSVPYLSQLRKGTIEAVPFERVTRLARFFQVPLDYFAQDIDDARPLVRPDPDVQRILDLDAPLMREIVLRAGQLGPAERALVLQMWDRARAVADEAEQARDRSSGRAEMALPQSQNSVAEAGEDGTHQPPNGADDSTIPLDGPTSGSGKVRSSRW